MISLELVPTRKELDAYYGNPRSERRGASPDWERWNLVRVTLPYPMKISWVEGQTVQRVRVHRKIADALVDALAEVLKEKGLEWIEDGRNVYGGCYEYRAMKGSADTLSVHAYGAAIDLNPQVAPWRQMDKKGEWINGQDPVFVKAFTDRGFVTFPEDGMHFQACKAE